jgi:glutamate synthase (NADPH/NADH) small chain
MDLSKMGKETGFLEIDRQDRGYADPQERIKHYREFVVPHSEEGLRNQAARCMNCGIPYCHNGCPVNNQIPDWNHLVYEADWREALANLHSTNNFPEFTGRVCPAPCEAACTLNIIDQPVTIKSIEAALADRGWKEGWIEPQVPAVKTGKSVAVVGSGPAGLAAAQQLARAGHAVTVFEKSDRVGGLLRYGIPDFKMEKHLINRRAVQMEAEGVTFKTSTEVGVDVSMKSLKENFDAIVLAGGAEDPRPLSIPGAEMPGVRIGGLGRALPDTRHGVACVGIGGLGCALPGARHDVASVRVGLRRLHRRDRLRSVPGVGIGGRRCGCGRG